MNIRLWVLYLILCSCVLNTHGQGVAELLEDHMTSHHQEKIYVSLDKTYYIPEDIIWGKVYWVDAVTHQSFDAAPIVYLDWIDPDGEILETYQLKAKDGGAPFSITTSLDNRPGKYMIRAYTQYQRNFDPHFLFQREVQLLDRADFSDQEGQSRSRDFNVQFFPEGGDLVSGLSNSVAFKAVDMNGNNINVSGSIVDNDGATIVTFNTWMDGFGKFLLKPELDQLYVASINHKDTVKVFPFPVVKPSGYTIKANTLREDVIVVEVNHNVNVEHSSLTIVGHVRGQIFLNRKLASDDKHVLSIKKETIPSGVVHLTLFDDASRPVSERLVFNQNPREKVEMEFSNLDASVSKKERVTGSINWMNKPQDTDQTYATLSVFNTDIFDEEISNVNIVSYLLLQSDLIGRVSNIHKYLGEDTRQHRASLDLLLMTHGWRRFNWDAVLNKKYPMLTYRTEESNTFSGKVTKMHSNKPVKADVSLTILDKDQLSSLYLTTDDDGLFYFSGFELPDSADVLIKAVKYNARKKKKLKEGELKLVGNKNVNITLFDLASMEVYDSVTLTNDITLPIELPSQIEKEEKKDNQDAVLDPTIWSLNIDEVVIKDRPFSARRIQEEVKKRYKEKGIFFFRSTQKFMPDDPQYDGFHYDDVFQMIRVVVPTTKLVTQGGRKRIIYGRLSNQGYATLFLDGDNIQPERLMAIDPKDILAIDVVTGMRAAALYNVGLAFVLLSRNPGERKDPYPGVASVSHPGYHKARIFYEPMYEGDTALGIDDYRTTLYWDADVVIKDKPISFSFYTGDLGGKHTIVLEGITEDGFPFFIQKEMYVDR